MLAISILKCSFMAELQAIQGAVYPKLPRGMVSWVSWLPSSPLAGLKRLSSRAEAAGRPLSQPWAPGRGHQAVGSFPGFP